MEARRRFWLEGAGVLLLGAGVMHLLYAASPPAPGGEIGAPGHDSYYHVAMASLVTELGAMSEFPWLKFTYFRDAGSEFVSHHWGFHVFLAPWVKVATWLKHDALAGGRWAMCFIFGVNLFLFHGLLRQRRVPLPWLWLALFFLLPDQFFARHGLVRAIGPSLAGMLLLLWAMFAGRFWWAAIAVAAYVHLYLGAVTFGPLVVAIFGASLAIGSSAERRQLWKLVACAALGWTVGVITHPYAAGMFEFLRLQIFGTGLSPDIEVGREWKPYTDAWFLVRMASVVLAVWFAALVVRTRFGPRLDARETALLVLQCVLLALTLKARRFIEYWPPICLLSAAYLAAPPLAQLLSVASGKWNTLSEARRTLAGAAGRVAAVALLAGLTHHFAASGLASAAGQLRCYYDLDAARDVMLALREHSAPGDVVFTDDWDIFPLYFYLNRHNHYIVGLDPKFTHSREPDLWNRYVKVSRGEVPSTIQPVAATDEGARLPVALEDIREHFGAKYVVVDHDHRTLADRLHQAPHFAELIHPTTDYQAALRAPFLLFRVRAASEDTEHYAGGGDIFLSDLTPVTVSQGWGNLQADRSVDGNEISLARQPYERGIGTHAPSRITYALPPGTTAFRSIVGVDDETDGLGSVVVRVFVDGQLAFSSRVLRGGEAPVEVAIDLGGAQRIQLCAETAEDGDRFDHVSWAEALFIAAGAPAVDGGP